MNVWEYAVHPRYKSGRYNSAVAIARLFLHHKMKLPLMAGGHMVLIWVPKQSSSLRINLYSKDIKGTFAIPKMNVFITSFNFSSEKNTYEWLKGELFSHWWYWKVCTINRLESLNKLYLTL